ncbi:uncharacterized protein K444DRAFT_625780 [Hyaloscypha bicolor E]|uniref:Heterokaryon incompatibility domain-containing protein n=1 Tax=Hyaloscypha bicolor E TaxID=1095630 RepID=A0A2J6TND6_9HELO|nr:uncharacterized protein K444DRAFT_625780 [Hyaloscypha bicolor E]PMD64529.1 hypothetical protein K444DRAFT_625780 [Hyaloscypha bicolor E]
MKNEDDRSIFAWGFDTVGSRISCFANSPADFAGCGDLDDFRTVGTHSGHVVMTNKGLSMEMRIIRLTTGDYIGQLTGKILDRLVYLAIPLIRHRRKENVFYLPRINVPQPDLSRGWCYTSPGEGFNGTDRTIFLGCSDQRGEKFAIKIDYTFQLAHSTKFSPFLRPMTAHIYASSLVTDHGRSLLERIISTGHLIGITMDWKEDLALGRIEASGIAGEFHSGSTWWLKLDGSDRNRWKIDVVDGFKLHFPGFLWARHSPISEFGGSKIKACRVYPQVHRDRLRNPTKKRRWY